MKRFSLIALVAVAVSALIVAQDKRRSQSTKVEQEIEHLMQDWNNSYLKGDKAAFDRIVAECKQAPESWMIEDLHLSSIWLRPLL